MLSDEKEEKDTLNKFINIKINTKTGVTCNVMPAFLIILHC